MSMNPPSPQQIRQDRQTDTINAVDLFCGAGGFSKGLKNACETLGKHLNEAAINHWDKAISTHKENNEGAHQYHSKVEQLHPPDILQDITGSKDETVDILVAGPECTFFSRARGSKPVTEQGRMSPWFVLDYLQKMGATHFIVENVPEIQDWGPVDEDGQPVKDGSIFDAWVNALNSLGYAVDWTELNAKDYGDPTSRKRFFIIGTKEGKVTFPDPTHSDEDDSLPDYRTAAEIIDWEDIGTSIWTRDVTESRIHSPPKETTLQRIGQGILRHCSDALDPFGELIKGLDRKSIKTLRNKRVVPQKQASAFAQHTSEPFFVRTRQTPPTAQTILLRQQDGAHPVDVTDRPVPTIATSGAHSIVSFEPTPLIEPKNGVYGGKYSNIPYRPQDRPTNTITTQPQMNLVTPYLTPLYSSRETQAPRTREIDRPLMTVVASKTPANVAIPQLSVIGENNTEQTTLQTSVTEEQNNNFDPKHISESEELVLCLPDMWPFGLNIKYRPLKAKELKQAQGFPEDYDIVGNKGERKKQVGNAVPVNLAQALCEHVLTEHNPSLASYGAGINESSDEDIPSYDEVSSISD